MLKKNSFMASLARLERATHCLEGSCSIQLSYRDTLTPTWLDFSITVRPLASETQTARIGRSWLACPTTCSFWRLFPLEEAYSYYQTNCKPADQHAHID